MKVSFAVKVRNVLIALVAAAALLFTGCAPVFASPADEWPAQAVQVFIPTSAGGTQFIDINKLGAMLQEELKVPFIVNPMPGAGGTIAMRHVMNAEPDGYTMLFGQSGIFSTRAMGVADFDSTAYEYAGVVVDDSATAIFAKPDQFPDFQSLVDYSKKNPGDVIWGTVMGGLTHMLGLSLTTALDIDWVVADIGDVAETTAAIMAGDCTINMSSISSLVSYMDAGTLKPILIFSQERSAAFPDVPCVAEFVDDLAFSKLSGFYFPKGTDAAIVAKFSKALEKAAASQEFKDHCKATYVDPCFYDAEKGTALLAEQQEFFKRAVEQMNSAKK